MKIKFVYFTCLFLTISAYMTAQISNSAIDNRTAFAYSDLISKVGKFKRTTKIDLRNVVGNPYTNKSFLPGKILFKNEKVDKLFLLRYNAYKDIIEVEVENGAIDNVLINEKISCIIGNDLYVYTTYKNKKNNEDETGYIKIILESDEYTLFSKQKKVFHQEKISPDPKVASYKAKYVGIEKFYLLDNANNTAYLLKKRKNFLERINSSSTKKIIKKFIKKERISFKKEKDLIRLLKHYNKIK